MGFGGRWKIFKFLVANHVNFIYFIENKQLIAVNLTELSYGQLQSIFTEQTTTQLQSISQSKFADSWNQFHIPNLRTVEINFT